MLDSEGYNFDNDTLLIPINTIADQGNTQSKDYNAVFDTDADFLICIHGKNDSHIYVDRYYDAIHYYFVESRMLSNIKPLDNANVKNSGCFDAMNLCCGYNLTVKRTNEVVPDKIYETGKLRFGNGNPESKEYTSLTDICFKDGKLEIRIPWQLLNVMDPSSKQQISDFWQTQVIMAQAYEHFDFGFAYRSDNATKLSISLNGSYTYSGWNMPTWHERLKPAYDQLKDYLAQYRESK